MSIRMHRVLAAVSTATLLLAIPGLASAAEPGDPIAEDEPAAAPDEPAATPEARPASVEVEDIGLAIGVWAGAGETDEAQEKEHGYATFGIDLSYRAMKGLYIGASFKETMYDQVYGFSGPNQTTNPGLEIATFQVSEYIHDARIFIHYNALATVTDLVSLEFGFAPRFWGTFGGDAFSALTFLPELYANVIFHPTKSFHIFGKGAWAPVAYASVSDMWDLGDPNMVQDYAAGFRLDIPTKDVVWAIEFYWAGEQINFKYTDRFYHGAHAGVRVAL